MTHQIVHPNDNQLLNTFEKLTDKQIKAAIKSAMTLLQSLKRIQY
jgi:uncharacterized protein (DUF433 family)